MSEVNPRQTRWALFFTGFHFSVTYRPGSKNTKADALSRIHEENEPTKTTKIILPENLLVALVEWDITTEINITNTQTPPKCQPERTYVPEMLRNKLLHQIHDYPSSGHPGITATLHLLENKYWWSSMVEDTAQLVSQCATCNTSKSSEEVPAGNTTILTVVDRFSKSCQLLCALETAETLCNFKFYGLPEDIVSDRGPQFTSRIWSAFFRLLNVNVSLTSSYHLQSNGHTDRLNQELTHFLRTYCQNHQSDWSRYLMWTKSAQNSLQKQATGLTPFKCVLGFQPPLFRGTI